MIADAAIRLLAENGSRAVSHRRVDQEAGLPIGTTIHHASTRAELLLMAARRLSEISMTELAPFSRLMEERGRTLSPEDVARELVALWRSRLGADKLFRLRAEITVLFSPEFEGEARALFRPRIDGVTRYWQDIMSHLGCRKPDRAGHEFGLWMRGLFYMLAARGEVITDEEYHELENRIIRFIETLLDD